MKKESIYTDIKELIEDRLTAKQLKRYRNMTGYFAKRVKKITKAKWVELAIQEVERREQDRKDAKISAFNEFADYVKNKTFKAKVRWFDKSSGEGTVTILDDNINYSYPIYACNIKGKKTWYANTACVYYTKDQIIDITVSTHGYGSPVFICGETQGHFDQEAWDSLDQDRLAFKCNEDGEATNGLFA